MDDFIINTPQHKRWWLPCRCHQYNTVLFGDQFHDSIIDSFTGETVTSWTIKVDPNDRWKDLAAMAQELARKNHPPKLGKLHRCKIIPLDTQLMAKLDYARGKLR